MIAHQMGADVTAEGIETLDQKQQVKALKCKYGQGFLYSKPLPATEAEKLLEGNSQIILRPQQPRLVESRAS
jgi:EAL domain-containing protein (putative c-di-GMP-specific phosphodiesterase class I)